MASGKLPAAAGTSRFSGLVEIVSTGEKKASAGDLELLEILSSEEKRDLGQTAVQPAPP